MSDLRRPDIRLSPLAVATHRDQKLNYECDGAFGTWSKKYDAMSITYGYDVRQRLSWLIVLLRVLRIG
jgi:hypothetical protein